MLLETLGFEGSPVTAIADEHALEALDEANCGARLTLRHVRSIAGAYTDNPEPLWVSELVVAAEAFQRHVQAITNEAFRLNAERDGGPLARYRATQDALHTLRHVLATANFSEPEHQAAVEVLRKEAGRG